MDSEDLIKQYFKLNADEKDVLLGEIVRRYFDLNLNRGFSIEQICNAIDGIIEQANKDENYEWSQAFLDIKLEIIKVIEKYNGL